MDREKYAYKRSKRKFFNTKTVMMALAICMMSLGLIGSSLAWLMTQTDSVTNVFTYGDIDIELEETTGEEYKMTPGKVLAKDPKVTVLAGSEDCWLFVKIDESTEKALGDYVEYGVADGWIALDGVAGVYYRTVDNNAENNQEFYVLKDNKVTVKGSVTKEMLEILNEENYPTMTVTAYAVQRDATIAEVDTVTEAWALVSAGN